MPSTARGPFLNSRTRPCASMLAGLSAVMERQCSSIFEVVDHLLCDRICTSDVLNRAGGRSLGADAAAHDDPVAPALRSALCGLRHHPSPAVYAQAPRGRP